MKNFVKNILGFLLALVSGLAGAPIAFGTTTRTEIPAEVNNFYDEVLLVRALPWNIHGAWGQKRNIKSKAGTNVIKFRRYGSLTVATTALTEGTTPAGQNLSVTDITATVLQYGDFTVITDIVDIQSIDPVLTEATELFGEQMGETNDLLCRDILVAGTTVQYASTAVSRITVTSAMTMTKVEVLRAVRTLGIAKAKRITSMSGANPGAGTVPISPAFIGIVHPRTTYTLKSLAGFDPVEKYASNVALLPNEIGRIDNVRFVETTNAKIFTGAGAAGIDVYATLIIGANAYGTIDLANSQSQSVIYKALGSAGAADPLNQRQSLGWKEFFVTKILNDSFMLRIEHAVE